MMNIMPHCRALLLLLALAPAARGDDKLPDGALRRMVVTEDGEGVLYCVTFSPDGKTLAVGGSLRRVHLFDAQTGELLRSFGNHPDNVWTVAWSPDGKFLCSGGRADLTLHVWDPKTGDELKPFEGHQGGITRIKFFRDGKRLIMSGGSWDPTIRVWDVERREQTLALTGHSNLIDAMDFAPHGRLAVSGSRDGSLRLWDLSRGREIWSEHETEEARTGGSEWSFRYGAVAFSPDGRMFAVGGHDGSLTVRETTTRRRCLPLSERNGALAALAFSPDGRTLAFASEKRNIVFSDARTGKELRVCRGHRSPVYSLAFSPDGKTLATCAADSTILLWRVPEAAELSKGLTDEERGRHVNLLGSDNAVLAHRATIALSQDSGLRLVTLARRAKATEPGDVNSSERWIAQLASRNYAEREVAEAELERAGEKAEHALRIAFGQAGDAEQRRRLDRLLEKIERRVPSGEELWQLRAVEVLELRNDAESRALLRKLAAGAPSRLTTEASEALERLK
jgi:Tol biopolymer transport system component